MATINTRPPSYVVDPDRNIRLGSGHRYFDITAPLNNTPWNYDTPSLPLEKLSEKDLFQASTMFVSYPTKENAYTTLLPIVQNIINTPGKKHLLSTRVNANKGSLDSYQNNRDNMLHWLFGVTVSASLDKEKRKFFKSLVKEIIKQGVNPLEKSTKTGFSALAYALNNFNIDKDLLTFCAKLHPDSLIDLTDRSDKQMTTLQYMCIVGSPKSHFDVIVDLIDVKDIEKNIESIKIYKGSTPEVTNVIIYLEKRLVDYEKSLISNGLSVQEGTPSNKSTIKI